MITKSVAALVYAPVGLLAAYVVHPMDEVSSFSLLLTAIFALFYVGISRLDPAQRRTGG